MTAIGLDLAYLAPGATGGMETYARALIPELARQRPGVRWVAFCGRELAAELRSRPWCNGLEVAELPVSSDTRFRRVAVEQSLLPARIRGAGVDLVHSLGNTAPLAPGGPPLVLTIMDLIWARLPETHAGLLAKGLSVLVPRAARRAARVIVPSRATGAHVEQFLGLSKDDISVVPLGPGLHDATPTPEAELRERLQLGDGPLILCPAPRRPHKNVARLVEATAGLDATLVVPGYASIAEEGVAGREHVRELGWVSDEDMEGLYRAATLLAFPSLAEGFGLPVLEAMRRGLPVACASTTSLPEVAGDAALQFDPLDPVAMRAAVERLLTDAALRGHLAARGREQAGRFSWEATAEATWRVYDEVLAAGSHRPAAALRRIAGHPRILPATALALRARTVRDPARFTASELRGGGRIRAHRLRSSGLEVFVRHGAGDAATMGEVFHEWHYEPPAELAAVLDAAGAQRILDLGANIGLFVAFAAARWPESRIDAFEPDPGNAALCARVIAANNLGDRATLHRAAAAAHAGTLRFSASGDALSHADEHGDLEVEAVDVLSLIAGADLLKLDVEGGEWALLGDPRFAAAPPGAIVLEYHPHLAPGPDPRAEVLALLDAAGLDRRAAIFDRDDGHGMLWAWRQ